MTRAAEDEWYKANNCQHAHCPYEHEHPQPFAHDGKLYCGYCWSKESVLTEMVPCTPDNCD